MLIRLHQKSVYELKVDTNGDAVADIAYRFTFSPKEDGVQKVTVLRANGEQAKGNGNNGEVIFKDVIVSFGDKVNTSGCRRIPPLRRNTKRSLFL